MLGDVKDLTDLLGLAPAVVGALVLLAGIVQAWRWTAPRLRRLGHLIDDLAGTPERPGVPRRPGVMERLQQVESRTGELVRNGGSSMRDALDRLDTRSARLDARTESLDRRLHRIEARVCPGREDQ